MDVSELQDIIARPISRSILGIGHPSPRLDAITLKSCHGNWALGLSQRIDILAEESQRSSELKDSIFTLGKAAFNVFLQANVTGPPPTWDSAHILPEDVEKGASMERLRKQLLLSLSVDGEAVYQLIPHIELFCLAKCLLNHQVLGQNAAQILARLRVNFWHQRLLSEVSPNLQDKLYSDLRLLEKSVLIGRFEPQIISPAAFLVERATIHLHHGFSTEARDDLTVAAQKRDFHFVLIGRLGKRTKYQEKELSQLVVLAKSSDQHKKSGDYGEDTYTSHEVPASIPVDTAKPKPQKLDLNDDTLLESISFTNYIGSSPKIQANTPLPESLLSLDPGNQPLLEPLDAIILLATASSITNTSPSDDLTREETLPYAERVLSGGSSNWQVYTQALLVRSRIEGYRSRTLERGVLQLQALVDQVIAETTPPTEPVSKLPSEEVPKANTPMSFLPNPKRSESAPASERLRYIYQLASPPRWKLEAELANRWVSLGGLRTALGIYERLQMWAEVALCWAANDREDKARKIIRHQLYTPVITKPTVKLLEDEETDVRDYGIERDPLPADAPRLFCILGDIEKSTAAYERAWVISNYRYARAQRSLGKHFTAIGELKKADEAYTTSLKVSPQNHTTWFALGCVRLRLEDWIGAVDAFGRSVQIDGEDGESWSNLAVALLRLRPSVSASDPNGTSQLTRMETASGDSPLEEDNNGREITAADPQRHVREAFFALKRAATLKRESFRIWQNLLSVAAKLAPPPYTDIIIAQARLIDLLGKTEGEGCIDVEIVEGLISHLVATKSWTLGGGRFVETAKGDKGEGTRKMGFEKMAIDLVQKKITPLITSSRRLWLINATLSLHLRHPAAGLAAYEKAWRVTFNQPGWDRDAGSISAKNTWAGVSEATIDLVDAYESLGERAREPGMGAGELVCKDWKFKARSALRSVMARAKEEWHGDAGYNALNERLQDLKRV